MPPSSWDISDAVSHVLFVALLLSQSVNELQRLGRVRPKQNLKCRAGGKQPYRKSPPCSQGYWEALVVQNSNGNNLDLSCTSTKLRMPNRNSGLSSHIVSDSHLTVGEKYEGTLARGQRRLPLGDA